MNNDVSEWAVVCIKLLQGPIIKRSEQDKIWNLLLRNRSYIDNYFSTIGITLLVEESDGYAFLRQKNESEDEDFEQLPRLIRRYRLSIEESFLCVILREALDYFETSDDVSEIFTMKESEIMKIKQRRTTFIKLIKSFELLYLPTFSQNLEINCLKEMSSLINH